MGVQCPPVGLERQAGVMNPAASTFPAACRGVSERMMFKIPSLGMEDCPELAPENFNIPFDLADPFPLYFIPITLMP